MTLRLLTTKIFLLLFIFTSFAQFTPRLNGGGAFTELPNTMTYAVLTGDEEFDKAFQEAVIARWTYSKVSYISEDQLSDYIHDRSNSFISLRDFKVKDTKQDFRALAVFIGGFADNDIYLSSTLAYVSMDKNGLESRPSSLNYRIVSAIDQLQYILRTITGTSLSANNAQAMSEVLNAEYTKNIGKLENMALLIDIAYTVSKISNIGTIEDEYPYAIIVVKKDFIEEAIARQDTSYAYLVSSSNTNKINSIVSCSGGEILYAEKEEQNEALTANLKAFDQGDMQQVAIAIKASKKAAKSKSKDKKSKQ